MWTRRENWGDKIAFIRRRRLRDRDRQHRGKMNIKDSGTPRRDPDQADSAWYVRERWTIAATAFGFAVVAVVLLLAAR